ncbi:MAG: Hsp20/alpha crystallin family protein [Clostridiales bacterium]|nr:Hsp20/alpha crystallin family protein [Clostridiales bacterium]
MLMPRLFGESLLDDLFDYPTRNYNYTYGTSDLMKTDIKDVDGGYELTMNLPGVKKEDVKAELKGGYLTISATTNSDKDEKDGNGKYIRRERYSGSFSRSFYIGEHVQMEDVKAKFEDGALKLAFPKEDAKPVVEENKYIAIE